MCHIFGLKNVLASTHHVVLCTCMHACDTQKGLGTSLAGSRQRREFEKKF